MAITGGFGIEFDLSTGRHKQWVMGRDGVKRWADTNAPARKEKAVLESSSDLQPHKSAADSDRHEVEQ